MLTCQRHRFSIPTEISYLNCAYMSPLLEKVEIAGYRGVARKGTPFEIMRDDFFTPVEEVQTLFTALINAPEPKRTAIIPSVSYGIANATQNIPAQKGQTILIVEEQFPSNYYSWKRLAEERGAMIKIVSPPKDATNRGEAWNAAILEAIDNQVVAVTMPQVHWADGTKFDLAAIGKKARTVGAYFVIDGTQSVGAMPFDWEKIQPDALICAAYKWLLGPYSIGAAWYGPRFDAGIPIEESWMNRHRSEDFQNLVHYQDQYKPLATRYNVGETSNFILIPMFKAALEQLLDWTPAHIQDYCHNLTEQFIPRFLELGCQVEKMPYRGSHLFGVRLSDRFDLNQLKQNFIEQKVFVSLRGNAIRISPHVYNNEADFERLLTCFE